jgi:hypothetical protein
MARASWSATAGIAETSAGPAIQLLPQAAPYLGPATRSAAPTLPPLSAVLTVAQATITEPDDQPTVIELVDELDDQPTVTDQPRDWFFLQLLMVILVAALIGSALVFLLR